MLAALHAGTCHAAALRFCDHPDTLSAAQKDRLLGFAALIKAELERSGASVALVSRSGLDLSRFGLRYSHAGFSLKDSPNAPWSVRQLYYACDQGRPRLFDQGLPGFLFGTDGPETGYVSVLLLPPARAGELERAALDNARALQLLGAAYSADAYAWGLRYQNCNQWAIELIAAAWGRPDDGGEAAEAPAAPRARAQRWLAEHAYEPTRVQLDNRLLTWAGAFVPWLHDDDHPSADIERMVYRISMPESIERFVREAAPGTTRIEFCHAGARVVVHRGWTPIAEGCVPGDGDEVSALDD